MKTLRTPLYFLVLLAFSGCATQPRVVLSQPVGPARPHLSRRKSEGDLVVATALEANTMDADHPTHSAYSIYGLDGAVVRHVDNRAGSFYQDPVAVSLPVGKYKVKAQATNAGVVEVPVIIEAGKTTVVVLDGTDFPTGASDDEQKWVRLPDGQIIGMRAD